MKKNRRSTSTKPVKPTLAGESLTALILDVFKLNGLLLLTGDRLVAEVGITSARWQVLGSIAYAERPESVAWHGRTMGLHRQGVQRIVNELEKQGILEFQPNPHHKRAHLVVLTAKGRETFEAAMALQTPWVNDLSSGFSAKELDGARKIIERLKARLKDNLDS